MKTPNDCTILEWAASLIVDFPRDNIPLIRDENEWRDWGNSLIQENSFSKNGAPGPTHYNKWRDWAKAVFRAMASSP